MLTLHTVMNDVVVGQLKLGPWFVFTRNLDGEGRRVGWEIVGDIIR
jgi:hypothetical protein